MAKSHKLSPEQDIAANPTKNIWVQANAGTGKTSVLVQRLLRILFRTPDCNTSGILCLTYTKAGAGEMRNRILKALRDWAMATDEELYEMLNGVAINKPVKDKDIAHAREIFFKYIDNPEILKIKTIHGFCEEILHRFPLEAGITPTWSLISGAPQRVLLQDVFNSVINNTNDDRVYNAFEHIVGRISETYLDKLLELLSGQYKHFFQVDDIVKYREYFIETIKIFLDLKTEKNYDFNVINLQNIIDSAVAEQKNKKSPAQNLDKIIILTKQFIDKTIDFEKYKTAYLNADGGINKNLAKKDYLVAEQSQIFAVEQNKLNKMIFDDTVALFDLAAAFANEYKQTKHAQCLLDFEDLILYTRKLFSNSATMGWVLSQLDLSLSQILVDEAQDTSPLQWDILNMLSGDFFTDGDASQLPHSMFVVGDTKQSIYGFQGADPYAFAASRDAISKQIQNNARAIQEVPLVQSFRSTAPILHTVDRFFADDGVIKISNFKNNPHKCFRVDAPGAVELHKLIAKKETGTDRKEYIKQIADKIKSLLDAGKYKARDIMVLVQQRGQFVVPLISELKHRGIDVAGNDRILLPEFPAVRDLLNLVRWCIKPTDDYSLCCVLKSPVFALKEDDIFNICKTRNNINHAKKQNDKNAEPTTIFEVLKDAQPHIYKTLLDIKTSAEYMAPYTFFSQILNKYNARQNFVRTLGEQVIDPLEEFMTICLSYERTQPGTLFYFIKWFINGNSEVTRDMDASSGVRIVTVHGSKGLEAPVVFLIDTIHTPKSDNIIPVVNSAMPVWLWSPRADASVLRNNAQEAYATTQTAEYYRLLYVAMTRARDELYIYGYTPDKNPPQIAWHTQLWRVLANSNAEFIRITNDDIK
ncbi:MAG: UvrD-helicase domain-containing protein [Alphaproteobacteria bacterium]|nr:UvrD-helicase domain-containing protein [Alphaproteobacteria bacterium]